MTPVQATAETGKYRLELDIGDQEQMYSKADAARLKPTGGEIMVSGHMANDMSGMKGMPGMSSDAGMQTDASMRHLELHVRSKTTGKAVRAAKVSITVSDTTGKQLTSVPIAVMYGIVEGQEDWHYGNNVPLPSGHYVIQVSANQETATFDVIIADK
jgi:hypothetical protein